MNILELAKKTQTKVLNQSNGASSSITYIYKLDNSQVHTRAFISYEEHKEIIDNREVISDSVVFYSTQLEKVPSKLDKIVLDDVEFKVERFIPNGLGFYDIYCFKDRFHTSNSDYKRRRF